MKDHGHQDFTDLVKDLYNYGYSNIDELDFNSKCELAIKILKNFYYFDPAEIIMYDSIPENTIQYLMELFYIKKKITSDEVLNNIVSIVINRARERVNLIFDNLKQNDM
jgi:hypothetical protein